MTLLLQKIEYSFKKTDKVYFWTSQSSFLKCQFSSFFHWTVINLLEDTFFFTFLPLIAFWYSPRWCLTVLLATEATSRGAFLVLTYAAFKYSTKPMFSTILQMSSTLCMWPSFSWQLCTGGGSRPCTLYIVHAAHQWRIQDFAKGGGRTKQGAKHPKIFIPPELLSGGKQTSIGLGKSSDIKKNRYLDVRIRLFPNVWYNKQYTIFNDF